MQVKPLLFSNRFPCIQGILPHWNGNATHLSQTHTTMETLREYVVKKGDDLALAEVVMTDKENIVVKTAVDAPFLEQCPIEVRGTAEELELRVVEVVSPREFKCEVYDNHSTYNMTTYTSGTVRFAGAFGWEKVYDNGTTELVIKPPMGRQLFAFKLYPDSNEITHDLLYFYYERTGYIDQQQHISNLYIKVDMLSHWDNNLSYDDNKLYYSIRINPSTNHQVRSYPFLNNWAGASINGSNNTTTNNWYIIITPTQLNIATFLVNNTLNYVPLNTFYSNKDEKLDIIVYNTLSYYWWYYNRNTTTGALINHNGVFDFYNHGTTFNYIKPYTTSKEELKDNGMELYWYSSNIYGDAVNQIGDDLYLSFGVTDITALVPVDKVITYGE